MKTIHRFLCALAAVILSGCSQPAGPEAAQPAATNETAADVRQKAAQAVTAARDYTGEEKDRVVAATSAKLARWNDELTKLGHKADTLSGHARDEANQVLDSMRQDQAAAARKLEALRQSGRDAWQKAKAGVDSAMATLEQTYTNAKAKVEPGR